LRPAWGAIRNAVRAHFHLPPVETTNNRDTTSELIELLTGDVGKFEATRKTTWYRHIRLAIRRGKETDGDLALVIGQLIWWSIPVVTNGVVTPQLTAQDEDDGYYWWRGRWESVAKSVGLGDQQVRRAVRILVHAGVVIQRPADREVWLRLDYLRVWQILRDRWRRKLSDWRKQLQQKGHGTPGCDPLLDLVDRLVEGGPQPSEPDE